MFDDKVKIRVWDLEVTHLKANMGFILSAAVKTVGEDDVYYWRIDNSPGYGDTPKSYMDDSHLVAELVDFLSDSDVLVHHYGDRFDLPYLNTRALLHGIPVLPPIRTIDTWRVARNYLALTSNRLDTVNDLVNKETQKYKLPWENWRLCAYGDKKAMDQLVDYNINDVVALEESYLALRPIIRNHPYVGMRFNLDDPNRPCPACASENTQQRGQRRTKCFIIKRHHCQNCGHWYDGKRSKVV